MRVARFSMFCSIAGLTLIGCKQSPSSKQDTTQSAQNAPSPAPNSPIMLRGTVVSVSASQLVLQADTGRATVALTQPFHIYARVPSTLSQVKETSFIGVTTVKQPDGSERATEIHVFPEELRGVGEGSRMMAPDTTGTAGRMTNGNVSAARMTNGTASPSRMSNGSVSSTNGSTLVVQYAGGSQTVTVPPNTPVTEFKIAPGAAVAGDKLAILVRKSADGSLSADKALSMAK